MDGHDPQVLQMADVADRWVVRCDCGCGVLTQYASRDEAEDAAEQARAEADPPTERELAIDDVVEDDGERAPERI
ncbi:hypothetical protein ACIGG9_13820 [Pseudonocardia alni]|uniref:hypothetical protein n=1 Tax=Pseudonocardia TaxID=1847 RepID=UPI0006CB03F0|nr:MULTISPECIES: hypothetical protein [Pseudonocardia]ALE81492.1 hypothetical protein WY02_27550 [Pseudonocardia sp. AL041005-10]MBO4238004.1 hypothetical protein [Pseudonocardia alni]